MKKLISILLLSACGSPLYNEESNATQSSREQIATADAGLSDDQATSLNVPLAARERNNEPTLNDGNWAWFWRIDQSNTWNTWFFSATTIEFHNSTDGDAVFGIQYGLYPEQEVIVGYRRVRTVSRWYAGLPVHVTYRWATFSPPSEVFVMVH